MRGEKLYVTKDKRRSQPWRRAACWGVGLALAAAAVLVAVLAGTGVILGAEAPLTAERGAQEEHETTSHESSSPGVTGSVTPATDKEAYVSDALEGRLKMTRAWDPSLADPSSPSARALASELEEALMKSIFTLSEREYGSHQLKLRVMGFEEGSVVAVFRVAWRTKEGVVNAPPPLASADVLRQRLQAAAARGDLPEDLRVQPNSVLTSRVSDVCQRDNGNCSHLCMFDHLEKADFKCGCPQGRRLGPDQHTCLDAAGIFGFGSGPHSGTSSQKPEPSSSPEPPSLPEPTSEPEPPSLPEPTSEPEPASEPEPTSEPEPEPDQHNDHSGDHHFSHENVPITERLHPEPSAEPVTEPIAEPPASPEPSAEPAASPEPAPLPEAVPPTEHDLFSDHSPSPEPAPSPEPPRSPEPTAEPASEPTAEPQPAEHEELDHLSHVHVMSSHPEKSTEPGPQSMMFTEMAAPAVTMKPSPEPSPEPTASPEHFPFTESAQSHEPTELPPKTSSEGEHLHEHSASSQYVSSRDTVTTESVSVHENHLIQGTARAADGRPVVVVVPATDIPVTDSPGAEIFAADNSSSSSPSIEVIPVSTSAQPSPVPPVTDEPITEPHGVFSGLLGPSVEEPLYHLLNLVNETTEGPAPTTPHAAIYEEANEALLPVSERKKRPRFEDNSEDIGQVVTTQAAISSAAPAHENDLSWEVSGPQPQNGTSPTTTPAPSSALISEGDNAVERASPQGSNYISADTRVPTEAATDFPSGEMKPGEEVAVQVGEDAIPMNRSHTDSLSDILIPTEVNTSSSVDHNPTTPNATQEHLPTEHNTEKYDIRVKEEENKELNMSVDTPVTSSPLDISTVKDVNVNAPVKADETVTAVSLENEADEPLSHNIERKKAFSENTTPEIVQIDELSYKTITKSHNMSHEQTSESVTGTNGTINDLHVDVSKENEALNGLTQNGSPTPLPDITTKEGVTTNAGEKLADPSSTESSQVNSVVAAIDTHDKITSEHENESSPNGIKQSESTFESHKSIVMPTESIIAIASDTTEYPKSDLHPDGPIHENSSYNGSEKEVGSTVSPWSSSSPQTSEGSNIVAGDMPLSPVSPQTEENAFTVQPPAVQHSEKEGNSSDGNNSTDNVVKNILDDGKHTTFSPEIDTKSPLFEVSQSSNNILISPETNLSIVEISTKSNNIEVIAPVTTQSSVTSVSPPSSETPSPQDEVSIERLTTPPYGNEYRATPSPDTVPGMILDNLTSSTQEQHENITNDTPMVGFAPEEEMTLTNANVNASTTGNLNVLATDGSNTSINESLHQSVNTSLSETLNISEVTNTSSPGNLNLPDSIESSAGVNASASSNPSSVSSVIPASDSPTANAVVVEAPAEKESSAATTPVSPVLPQASNGTHAPTDENHVEVDEQLSVPVIRGSTDGSADEALVRVTTSPVRVVTEALDAMTTLLPANALPEDRSSSTAAGAAAPEGGSNQGHPTTPTALLAANDANALEAGPTATAAPDGSFLIGAQPPLKKPSKADIEKKLSKKENNFNAAVPDDLPSKKKKVDADGKKIVASIPLSRLEDRVDQGDDMLTVPTTTPLPAEAPSVSSAAPPPPPPLDASPTPDTAGNDSRSVDVGPSTQLYTPPPPIAPMDSLGPLGADLEPAVQHTEPPVTPLQPTLPPAAMEVEAASASAASHVPTLRVHEVVIPTSSPAPAPETPSTSSAAPPSVAPITGAPEDSRSSSSTSTTSTTSPAPPPPPPPPAIAGFSRCAAGQFQCTNGTSREGLYCVAAAAACDSLADCSDGSDEKDCEARGCPGAFRCRSGRCLARALVCNGLPDCDDASDEDACDEWKCLFDEFRCPNGRCIPALWQCDGRPDCPGHADEYNCQSSCGNDEFLCPEGWCAPLTYRCDGTPDCAGGEDEQLCECPLDQRACDAGGCVARESVCDGVSDCPDGSDEWGCVRLNDTTRLLQVRHVNGEGEASWASVCSDDWDSSWSDAVCRGLGRAAAAVTGAVPLDASAAPTRLVRLANTTAAAAAAAPSDTPLPKLFAPAPSCFSGTAVELTCQPFSCGSHGVAYSARLVGGDGATSGQWPSVAQLVHARSHALCTATIISPLWLLASLSCLRQRERELSATGWAAVAGGAAGGGGAGSGMGTAGVGAGGGDGAGGRAGGAQVREVAALVAHPGARKGPLLLSPDLALARLARPLDFGPDVGAVCLPQRPIEPRQLCVMAGWGRPAPGELRVGQLLHYLPVPTVDSTVCNSSQLYRGLLAPGDICAGYTDAERSPCYNDEGAPLLCVSPDEGGSDGGDGGGEGDGGEGVWQLQGVLAHHAHCGRAHRPAVFSSVHAARRWVENVVGAPLPAARPSGDAPAR